MAQAKGKQTPWRRCDVVACTMQTLLHLQHRQWLQPYPEHTSLHINMSIMAEVWRETERPGRTLKSQFQTYKRAGLEWSIVQRADDTPSSSVLHEVGLIVCLFNTRYGCCLNTFTLTFVSQASVLYGIRVLYGVIAQLWGFSR